MFRKGKSAGYVFAAIDSVAPPARKSGLTFSGAEVQVSKDGGSFSNITSYPTEIGSTGRYSLALSAAEMDAATVLVKVVKSGMDDLDIIIRTTNHPSASVVADGGNTALTFKTDLTEATDDHWKDALVLFTSGALDGQVKEVSAYNGTTKFITVSEAFTGAPSASDRFILVNI